MLFNLKNKTKKEIICFGTKPFGKQAPFDYLKNATYTTPAAFYKTKLGSTCVFFRFFLSKRLLLIL